MNFKDHTYWVIPGRFLAGKTPVGNDDASTQEALRQLAETGIEYIINLMHEDEVSVANRPYGIYENALQSHRGPIQMARFPILDMDVPTMDEMQQILNAIDQALSDRKPVYVHCWGGKGRTGTVVGSWLKRHGKAENSTVFTQLQDLRASMPNAKEQSPETAEQCRFVEAWRKGE